MKIAFYGPLSTTESVGRFDKALNVPNGTKGRIIMTNIVPLKRETNAARMDDKELKDRFEEIKNRKPDPDWARLFLEARNRGRTQEEIAAVIGKKQRLVSYLLTYADFIYWYENSTTVLNAEFRLYEVTEYKFRRFWNKRLDLKHDINARRRAVLSDLIDHQKERDRHDNTQHLSMIKKIKAQGLVNGRKYRAGTIAKKIGEDPKIVKDYLSTRRGVVHGFKAERTGTESFKLHPVSGKKVNSGVILSQINEYLEELKKMSKHPLGSMHVSPSKIAELVYLIETTIKNI